jgi:hypothetical protein
VEPKCVVRRGQLQWSRGSPNVIHLLDVMPVALREPVPVVAASSFVAELLGHVGDVGALCGQVAGVCVAGRRDGTAGAPRPPAPFTSPKAGWQHPGSR